jgi:hypothetical protein
MGVMESQKSSLKLFLTSNLRILGIEKKGRGLEMGFSIPFPPSFKEQC